MTTYQPGRFTTQDARRYSLALVTLITHPGDKTGEGAEIFERKLLVYVPDRRYVMLLPEDFQEGVPDPDAVVSYDDVAEVVVHATYGERQ